LLLADEFVEFCNPRRNVKSAAGPQTFIIFTWAQVSLILLYRVGDDT